MQKFWFFLFTLYLLIKYWNYLYFHSISAFYKIVISMVAYQLIRRLILRKYSVEKYIYTNNIYMRNKAKRN